MKRWNPFEDKIKVGRKVKILHTGEIGEITVIDYTYQEASILFSDGGFIVYNFNKFEVLEDDE